MTKTVLASLIAILFNLHLYGQDGYRCVAVIENSEILLESGPADLFGNAGGPFLMTIKYKNGKVEQRILHLHYLAVTLENGPIPKIWSYGRSSATAGTLRSITLNDKYHTESVEINPGDGGTDMGRDVYKSIFSDERRLHFEVIANYEIPKYFDDFDYKK